MKNMINEKLLIFANAQESMRDLVDKMEQWNDSHLNTENNAFESMNVSDYVLNMSREGKRLITMLEDCYSNQSQETSTEKCIKMNMILNDIKNMFLKITEASLIANDISHKIETEVAMQKEIGESIKKDLINVGGSIDDALACAELMMTDL